MMRLLTKVFGTRNERILKGLQPQVGAINEEFEKLKILKDQDFPKKTEEFRQRLKDGETLDEIMVEAFALVKETTRRLLGKKWDVTGLEKEWDMVPFDVQLMGAIVLHQGKIAEMATGEGKTLVATMPLYLNALAGKGAHLVTVNDYLARRDREWMGKIYEFLGLSVGVIQTGMDPEERTIQYNCDITYGTNNEFGFDYLRDNMAVAPGQRVQRGHPYAIVDEIDSVCIDEARTPLIISGAVEHSTHKYDKWKPRVERLYRTQIPLVNQYVSEGEKLLKEGNEKEAALKFLTAKRGAPKNRKLMKLEKEKGVLKMIESLELQLMRDKKLHEIDEELYYSIDERGNTVNLCEKGMKFLSPDDPDFFKFPDLAEEIGHIDEDPTISPREKAVEKDRLHREYAEKSEENRNVQNLLKAYELFKKDDEYIVKDGKVVIVDEFTGRLMPGRRFSEGLHQALEAKENVTIEKETQTLATITLQNYFKMYNKLAGMTGTAETEAAEFLATYDLEVVVIPTNRPVRRIDYDDIIYKTRREKYNAVIEEIIEMNEMNRPILVGTVSVEVSETLSRMLKRRGIRHHVLNAKHHQKEAEIVAYAGEPGMVTIATNMAGRGTDIKLGEGVVKCDYCQILFDSEDGEYDPKLERKCRDNMPCGLHIIGTERHESRRIDRQLRGRSGRQGDPGSSRFYLSLEDDLMRLFGSDKLVAIMDRIGIEDNQPIIQNRFVTRRIEAAQKTVERMNFGVRKRLLEYDDVMNKQRENIYERRNEILDGENLKDTIAEIINDIVDDIIETYTDPGEFPDNWDWTSLKGELIELFLIDWKVKDEDMKSVNRDNLRDELKNRIIEIYSEKERLIGAEKMRELERRVMLQVIDTQWRDHLYELDALKQGIGLRGYAHKDPLVEYKRESFSMFEELLGRINDEVVKFLFRIRIESPDAPKVTKVEGTSMKADASSTIKERETPVAAGQSQSTPHLKPVKSVSSKIQKNLGRPINEQDKKFLHEYEKLKKAGKKIGRNDPCPCGSGKKFKKCHGKYL
jgi:preprotein translocase subunit SecA